LPLRSTSLLVSTTVNLPKTDFGRLETGCLALKRHFGFHRGVMVASRFQLGLPA
jgi:hypothetical protein